MKYGTGDGGKGLKPNNRKQQKTEHRTHSHAHTHEIKPGPENELRLKPNFSLSFFSFFKKMRALCGGGVINST